MKAIHFLLIPLFALAATATDAAKSDEKSALAVLASDADTQKKARACQKLAVVGGPKAVPALAALLSNEHLASYARSGLEVIDDPAAGEALRAALPKLKGRLLTGVVTSLGVRGDKAAVPSLQKIVGGTNLKAAESALASLARIGTQDAFASIVKTLKNGPARLRVPAAHAVLTAAEMLVKQGEKKAAKKLLKSIRAADVPEHIKQAATALFR